MARQEGPLAAPLPGPIRERQERKAGYETTKEDITKWQPLVKANREAPTLEFKSGRDDVARSNSTAALAAKFVPGNDMEEQIAELLRAAGAHSGEAVEEAEEALALQVGVGYMHGSAMAIIAMSSPFTSTCWIQAWHGQRHHGMINVMVGAVCLRLLVRDHRGAPQAVSILLLSIACGKGQGLTRRRSDTLKGTFL